MKAIETEYNGIVFRSKTEAKWALFMDLIGCRYFYEYEAFCLGDEGCYLPDFWLPDVDKFLEIKPIEYIGSRQSPTHALCSYTKKSVVTFNGPPVDPEQGHYLGTSENGIIDIWDDGGGVGWDSHYWFCVCPRCKRVGIEFMGRADRIRCCCKKKRPWGQGLQPQ